MWSHRERANLKYNAYNKIYLSNFQFYAQKIILKYRELAIKIRNCICETPSSRPKMLTIVPYCWKLYCHFYQKSSWVNEWTTVHSHRIVWTDRERATLKRNDYSEIYSGNTLNLCIYLTTAWVTERSQWWQMGITLLSALIRRSCCPTNAKSWESWIRHHSCPQCPLGQIMLLVHVMHPY